MYCFKNDPSDGKKEKRKYELCDLLANYQYFERYGPKSRIVGQTQEWPNLYTTPYIEGC